MGGGTGEAGGAAGTAGHWTAGRGRGTAPAGVAWSTPAASGGEEEEEERHRKFNNKRALSDLCALQCATCCHKVAAKAWEMNQERSQLLFSPFPRFALWKKTSCTPCSCLSSKFLKKTSQPQPPTHAGEFISPGGSVVQC